MTVKLTYTSIIAILTFGILVGAFRTRSKQGALARMLFRLMVIGCATMVSAALFVLSARPSTALLAQGLYFSCTDWLALYLFHYILVYTDFRRPNRIARGALYAFAAADTVSLLLNTVTGHLFTVVRVPLLEAAFPGALLSGDSLSEAAALSRADSVFVSSGYSPLYYLHLAFVYLLIAAVFALLLKKRFAVPKFYRRKYSFPMISLILIFLVNAACLFLALPIDVSVPLYALFAWLMSYYALSYIPNTLVRNTLSPLVEDLEAAVLCFDLDGKCIFTNRAAQSMLSLYPDLALPKGDPERRLHGKPFDNDGYVTWNETRRTDGKETYLEIECQKLFDRDGSYIGRYFSIKNRTEETLSLRRERYLATHDALTGLYNREYFFEMVEKKIAAEPDVPRCMLCSNIKDFKLINDLFGEQVGNELLIEQAAAIRRLAKDGAVYGRIVGDRFALCIPKARFDESLLLEQLQELNSHMIRGTYRISLHVGVYEIQPSDGSASLMYNRADLAIHTVKSNYGQVISYYTEELLQRSLYERQIIGEFDRALTNREFCIYLQPQTTADGTMLGAEALVRWIHPDHGFVSPGDFVPIFERAGLIYKLDLYVWELAAKQLKFWKEHGHPDYYISVNISPKDIYYVDLYRTFTGFVEKYGISPANLKLEITETALMENLEQCLLLFAHLQEYGFQIEIDDFGSGYSSLNILKDLNADILKIDMGFLHDTEDTLRSRTILDTIVSLSRLLKMAVITEGVETRAQVDFLSQAGCSMFQGYYFSKPLSVAEFEQRYFSGRS